MNQKMEIVVKLFAYYREGKFKVEKRVYDKDITVKSVIEDVGIDIKTYPIGILLINSKHTNEESILQNGDTLSIFPKVGGG